MAGWRVGGDGSGCNALLRGSSPLKISESYNKEDGLQFIIDCLKYSRVLYIEKN